MRSPDPWLIAAGLWIAGLVLFVAMALLASIHDTFPGDIWLAQRIQDFDWASWKWAMDQTEDFAQMPLIAFVTMGAALLALLIIPPLSAVLIPLTLFGRPLIPFLKDQVERPRPTSEDIVVAPGQPGDFSFPSGHAFAAMLLYGLIFYLAAVNVRNPWVRVPIQLVCGWIIVVTGIERVYSGSHWPSDVLGGCLLAALFIGLLAGIDRVVSKRRAR